MSDAVVYTIGHGILEYSQFFTRLSQFCITVIVDIRRIPYSKYAKQYDRETLEKYTSVLPFRYMYMGDVLGSIGFDEAYCIGGHIRYDKRESEEDFTLGIERICSGVQKGFRIVLMCAEQEPAQCHRHLLLAKALLDKGITVHHIAKDGRAIPATALSFTQNLLL